MSKFLLIDMRDYTIASRHETRDAAIAAHDNCEHPAHVMELGGDWPEFSGVDLAKTYNAIPGVDPVKRFESRATGVKRVNETILNPPNAATRKTTTPTPQETPIMSKKKTAAPKKKASTRKRVDETTATVSVTAAGKRDDRRQQAGSGRTKVLEAIKRADGSLALAELVKRCAHFAKRSQVLGAVHKLIATGDATISS